MPTDADSSLLACPQCSEPLLRSGGSYCCAQGHSFDIARQGYVNLLPPAAHTGTADTAEMIAARQSVLAGPHFGPLVACVAQAAAHAASGVQGCIVDVGAGSGEYLAAALERLPGYEGIALDISRYACRRSARAHPAISSVVCDAWQHLPLPDGVAAVVMSVFAPRNAEEFERVLVAKGSLVVAMPTPAHLGSLVDALGLVSVDADKPGRLEAKLGMHFECVAAEAFEREVAFTLAEAKAVVEMGPSARHIGPDELDARLALLGEPLLTRLSVTISTWKKREVSA